MQKLEHGLPQSAVGGHSIMLPPPPPPSAITSIVVIVVVYHVCATWSQGVFNSLLLIQSPLRLCANAQPRRIRELCVSFFLLMEFAQPKHPPKVRSRWGRERALHLGQSSVLHGLVSKHKLNPPTTPGYGVFAGWMCVGWSNTSKKMGRTRYTCDDGGIFLALYLSFGPHWNYYPAFCLENS